MPPSLFFVSSQLVGKKSKINTYAFGNTYAFTKQTVTKSLGVFVNKTKYKDQLNVT